MRLLGKRPITAAINKHGSRLVTVIDRCNLCGVYGYLAHKVNESKTAHADIELAYMPTMIVRKITKDGYEYDPTCVECVANRMYPDNEPKEAKK